MVLKSTIRLSLLLLLLVGCTEHRDPHKAITGSLKVYLSAADTGDWPAVLDRIYPKVFEVIPREQLRTAFQQMESSGIRISTGNVEVSAISEILPYDNELFARVDYTADIRMVLDGQRYDEQMIAIMKEQLEAENGSGNVQYFPDEKTFLTSAHKSVFAIADKEKSSWKFVENTPQQMALLGNGALPQAVIEKLR